MKLNFGIIRAWKLKTLALFLRLPKKTFGKKQSKPLWTGKKQVEIAEILNVTRQAVGKWVSKYRTEGEESLKAKRKGRPEGGKLLPW